MNHPPTLILRHARENLKKCSLRGLEGKSGFSFYTYPKEPLPNLSGYLLLKVGAPPLTAADGHWGLLLLDGTWRLAEKMERQLPSSLPTRSLPPIFRTVYPRRQTGCLDPTSGLASVEALFLSHLLLGRSLEGILDHYYWKEPFLELNRSAMEQHQDVPPS